MLNGLDLFTGIGGISYGLQKYVKPIAYCEKDRFCQAVLISRIADRHLGNAPIWDDIRSLDGKKFLNSIDIIYGGFPCQDISIAGNGKGLAGEQSGLFFEIMRLAKEIKPKFLFLENVPAITKRGGLKIVREINSLGYDCRWCIISAASVGALHKRERWFLLAHAPSSGTTRLPCGKEKRQPVAFMYGKHPQQNLWQKAVCKMDKCSDGIPYHMAKLKALGNAVVPIQAKKAFEILMGINGKYVENF